MDQEIIQKYYQLLECNPEDGDVLFEKKYDIARAKYCNDEVMQKKLAEAYRYINMDRRKGRIIPGDDKGEERCLRNIEDALLSMQRKLKEGCAKRECIEEINSIKYAIDCLEDYWVQATLKHLKNNSFKKYCTQDDYIRSFFDKNMMKRILGAKEDKVFGWLKNYSEEKGDFVHYARNSMAHMRTDLKAELCKMTTYEMDIVNKYDSRMQLSDEEAKITRRAEALRQKNYEKYNIPQLLEILAKGPALIKISEAVNPNSQANEYARYFMVNIAVMVLKEIVPKDTTASMLEHSLNHVLNETQGSISVQDIYDSLSQQLINYIMVKECYDIDDIIDYDLRKYSELGIEQKGTIRFFKKGIKYIDEILVSYYAVVKEEKNKDAKSIKTIRSRHWKRFRELALN